MLELHNKVLAIKADNKTWTDLCYRIPIADIFLTKRRKKRQSVAIEVNNNPQNPSSPAVLPQNTERIPKLINDDLNKDLDLIQDDYISPFDDYYSNEDYYGKFYSTYSRVPNSSVGMFIFSGGKIPPAKAY